MLLLIKNNKIMKSKTLRSLNQRIILGLIALSTFAFASCSRSLTSLQNTKKLQNEQVLINPSVGNAEKQIAVAQQAEKPATAIAQQPKKLAGALINTNLPNLKTKKSDKLALHPLLIKNMILNKVEKQVAAITFAKNSRAITSINNTSGSEFEGSIRRAIICFVIAVVFFLVGDLFFWHIGYVFYVIGTIFLIVGIIYLLFWLLREM